MKPVVQSLLVAVIAIFMLNGCIGTIVGTAADVAIEVVKVPFKVGGAVIDVVSGDDDDDDEEDKKKKK